MMVADEAHWGISKGFVNNSLFSPVFSFSSLFVTQIFRFYLCAGQAHDQMVNDSKRNNALLDLPNFLVLQVSATPYSLLTRDSRIPMICLASQVLLSSITLP